METEMNNSYPSRNNKSLGFGLVLMLVGALFLAFNFNFITFPLNTVIFSWQMLLIFIGAINLYKAKVIPGVILVFVGSFFIIPKIFPEINEQFIHIYWPVLLIAAGIVILLQRIIKPDWGFETWEGKTQKGQTTSAYLSKMG